MSDEYEFDALSREEVTAMLYRLADGVAVGSVSIGGETIAVPDSLAVELEREEEAGERELELEVTWPLSAEHRIEVPEAEMAASGEDVDPALVQDSPVEAAAADEPGVTRGRGTTARAGDAPSPTGVVEPGQAVESGSKATFELFEDAAGEWRWRLVHQNGNVIADSGEGYSRKAEAENGLRSVRANAPGAETIEE